MLANRLFITLEGLSGSGKTTLATLLAKRLGGQYYKTPPEMFLPIRDCIEANATPLARYLYYYAGIAQASAEIEILLKTRTVVCDKYLATVLAYSRAFGANFASATADLVVAPSASFFLDLPDELRMERITGRERITRTHRTFLEMELTYVVRLQFQRLGLVSIDNSDSDPATALAKIMRHLQVLDVAFTQSQ
jgi:dTMP kinase